MTNSPAIDPAAAPPRATGPLRVVLADPPGPGRRVIAAVLGGLANVVLADVAGDEEELAVALRRCRPDVLVIDDRLLAGHALADLDATRLLVLGVDTDPGFAARAARLGAEAWIPKDRADEQLPVLLAG